MSTAYTTAAQLAIARLEEACAGMREDLEATSRTVAAMQAYCASLEAELKRYERAIDVARGQARSQADSHPAATPALRPAPPLPRVAQAPASEAERERALELLRGGATQKEAGRAIGRPRSTISNWAREAGLSTPRKPVDAPPAAPVQRRGERSPEELAQLKAEALRLHIEEGLGAYAIHRRLGVAKTTAYGWVGQVVAPEATDVRMEAPGEGLQQVEGVENAGGAGGGGCDAKTTSSDFGASADAQADDAAPVDDAAPDSSTRRPPVDALALAAQADDAAP